MAGRAARSKKFRPLIEAAAVDGATRWQAFRWILLPIVWPIIAAAGVLVMLLSITETAAVALLLPQRPPMLMPLLLGWVHMQRYDPMIESSLMLMGLVSLMSLTLLQLGILSLRLWRRAARPAMMMLIGTGLMVMLV